eukprot:73284-Chlamydomonas_euryale.AAC.3
MPARARRRKAHRLVVTPARFRSHMHAVCSSRRRRRRCATQVRAAEAALGQHYSRLQEEEAARAARDAAASLPAVRPPHVHAPGMDRYSGPGERYGVPSVRLAMRYGGFAPGPDSSAGFSTSSFGPRPQSPRAPGIDESPVRSVHGEGRDSGAGAGVPCAAATPLEHGSHARGGGGGGSGPVGFAEGSRDAHHSVPSDVYCGRSSGRWAPAAAAAPVSLAGSSRACGSPARIAQPAAAGGVGSARLPTLLSPDRSAAAAVRRSLDTWHGVWPRGSSGASPARELQRMLAHLPEVPPPPPQQQPLPPATTTHQQQQHKQQQQQQQKELLRDSSAAGLEAH